MEKVNIISSKSARSEDNLGWIEVKVFLICFRKLLKMFFFKEKRVRSENRNKFFTAVSLSKRVVKHKIIMKWCRRTQNS